MRRLLLLLMLLGLAAPGTPLTGIVVDESGHALHGARVRLRAASTHVLSGHDGRFVLAHPGAGPDSEITAAHPGHLIGGTTLKAGISEYRIVLRPAPTGDDPTYPWVTAIPESDEAPRTDFGREPCGACHRRILSEWRDSAHARSAVNPRFLAFAEAEHPSTAATCDACHVPMQSAGAPKNSEPVTREGVGCDLCHKSADAAVATSSRFGVLALGLRRPPFGHQAIFGPFDDVPRGRDVFAPAFRESRFCGACHQLSPNGAPVYSEFEEWQASRHAAEGTTCQNCHMRSEGQATTMADLGPGRITRTPAALSSHRVKDSRTPAFLADAIDLALSARVEGDGLVVEVRVANAASGHHLPAGSPMRHMLLVVSAESSGRPLPLEDGPTLPRWSGPSLEGHPGRGFAKLLADADGASPAPHWRAASLVTDTRIAAGSSDRSRYRFIVDQTGPIRIDAQLLVRRTFPAWADAAGIDIGEIVAVSRSLILPAR